MATIISNAFSFNMVQGDKFPCSIRAQEISLEELKEELRTSNWESSIGHGDMAKVLSEMTGFNIPANRRNDSLENGDVLLIAQYTGPRLPEGATSLPEGAKIKFIKALFVC